MNRCKNTLLGILILYATFTYTLLSSLIILQAAPVADQFGGGGGGSGADWWNFSLCKFIYPEHLDLLLNFYSAHDTGASCLPMNPPRHITTLGGMSPSDWVFLRFLHQRPHYNLTLLLYLTCILQWSSDITHTCHVFKHVFHLFSFYESASATTWLI